MQPGQAASLRRRITCAPRIEEEDRNEEEGTDVLKTCNKSRKSRFFVDEKALEERKGI